MAFETYNGFGKGIGGGRNPAIIVVDYINGFTDPNSPLGGNFDKEVNETKSLLRLAREVDIPIIFTVVEYEEHYQDGGYFVEKVPALKSLLIGSHAVQVDPRLELDRTKEPVVIKKFASSFFGTELSSILTFKKIDTVIITGCTTSGCVRATAVDAMQYGYRVIIPEECVGDRSENSHETSLNDIHLKYGDVLKVSGVKEYLKSLQKKRFEQSPLF